MNTTKKILQKTQIPRIITTQYILIAFGILLSALCFFLIYLGVPVVASIIAALLSILHFIVPSFLTLVKITKIKSKIKQEKYRVVNETLIDKKYEDENDDENVDIKEVVLKNNDGKKRIESANIKEFELADIGDRFITVYFEGEETPFITLPEKECSAED